MANQSLGERMSSLPVEPLVSIRRDGLDGDPGIDGSPIIDRGDNVADTVQLLLASLFLSSLLISSSSMNISGTGN